RPARLLLDGERVHVGAKTDAAPGAAIAADEADDAGPPDPGNHFVTAEFLQLAAHETRRLVHIEKNLRPAVEMAPPCRNLVMKLCCAVYDRHEDLSFAPCGRREVPGQWSRASYGLRRQAGNTESEKPMRLRRNNPCVLLLMALVVSL